MHFYCKTEHNKWWTRLVCNLERIIYSKGRAQFCQQSFMVRMTCQRLTLHILVIWAISFKVHKILPLEKQQSLIILFSLYTTREGSIKTKVWVFFPFCKKKSFLEHKVKELSTISLYECLRLEKHFITKCPKKERKTEVLPFFSTLDCPQPFQLC